MEQLEVQTIIEDKCWIVTHQGAKVGTVMRVDEVDGGVVFVHDNQRERFRSIASLMSKYNFNYKNSAVPALENKSNNIYGYPCCSQPHNTIIDARRKLPLYTTKPNSKSFHCAGYYYIKYRNNWYLEFCPKLLTLKRHEYTGPFTSKKEALAALKEQQQ
ncbi:hypothetical protein UFOVP116_269 [uncultured Caudovirales phage]|uniref:Uncharacterized protein n=1 Tax=uncultured Caudovirales phage TaxID=2100421 RepID=A0A6J5LEN0_9CAUD|nr:hypothetical protein UFOVP116_269 [uncultured Caudovirales phage]